VVLPKIYNGTNRTFFFFNYERLAEPRFQSNILTVPTEPMRTGDFSNLRDANRQADPDLRSEYYGSQPSGSGFIRTPFANNVIPTNRQDPASLKMMQFYPLPNRTPANAFTNASNWIGQVNEQRHMNQYTIKADHRISEKNTISGRFLYYKHFNDNGFAGALPDPNVRERWTTTSTTTPRLTIHIASRRPCSTKHASAWHVRHSRSQPTVSTRDGSPNSACRLASRKARCPA
jgi:hypothetical protein